jgi:Ca2+-binding RTX toxin-like protein
MAVIHINSLGVAGGFPSGSPGTFGLILGLPRVTGGGTTATGGVFSFSQSYETASIEYFLGENGNVTSFRFLGGVTGNSGLLWRDYLVSELDIPLSVFEANLSNLTALVVAGDDVIYGNDLVTSSGYSGRQTIRAGSGNDIVYGLGSDDALYGEDGNDRLVGGAGNDALFGGAGNDVLLPGTRGPEGNGNHNQSVDGGDGVDTISFEYFTTAIEVNLNAGTAREMSLPLSAPLLVDVITNVEYVTGGAGNDFLFGNSLANSIAGGAGIDLIVGGAGNDRLSGDAGDDSLIAGDGNDVCFGGVGNDAVNGGTGNDILYGDAGNDFMSGGIGNDGLYGGAGNDTLYGDLGADILNGGSGIDLANYNSLSTGVTVSLTNSTGIGGFAEGDRLISIENVTGSLHNDVLVGNSAANSLLGYFGNDQLFGLAGNDLLEGQAGDDALFGGDGNDILGGGDGNDGLFADAGHDTLYGGYGNDYLAGGDGNDVVWGDVGNDQIDAGAGDDYIVLGIGNDGFTLGTGDDRVRFDYGNGQDTIFDFGNGRDIIDFTFTDMSLAVLQANAVDTAAGLLLQVGSGSILLAGLALYQIEWNADFAFAV